MRGLDQYAQAMKSGGSTRNAAKMVVLDMDHPDILETKDGRPGFIRCKAVEEKRAHDLILKAGYSREYDDPNGAYKNVNYQNANHSVSIPDEFMHAVSNDGRWHTRDRRTGEIIGTYKARDLWKEIAKAAWMCADPGVQFSTTMNKWHTTPENGPIRASNPCSEFLHVDNTACNLCAINLTKFFDNKEFNFKRFEQSVRLFVTAQNAIINKADYPTKIIEENSHKLRPIGLNYGDLGALIMSFGYGYDSDEGRAIAARMASLMTGLAYMTSAKLATRTGAFPDFDVNKSHMMDVMKMHQDADSDILRRWGLHSDPIGNDVVSKSAQVWEETIRLGRKYGYTISQATLQAPLGTISFLMGMNTTGIEPAFSLVSYKTLVGGGLMKLTNNATRDGLVALGYSSSDIQKICEYIEDNDTIEGAPGFKDEHLSVFDCAIASKPGGRHLTPKSHITMMAAIQPLITCAMSKTVNMSYESTVDDIADLYLESWKLGLKCVAIYRNGTKLSQPLETRDRTEKQDKTEETVKKSYREKLPQDLTGHRHKFAIDGYKGYIQMNNYPDGRLGEVFVRLGKPGSTISGLVDSFTKLLSIGLQYGIPLEDLIESFADTRFEPAGMTTNPKIRFAKSIYDYIFRYLDSYYFKGLVTGVDSSHPEIESEPNVGISRSLAPKGEIKKRFDGPPCTNCGAMTVRNGSCYLCQSCGTTTGCS
jgi:ribonucleoside-diphosphate reductase alpha chain